MHTIALVAVLAASAPGPVQDPAVLAAPIVEVTVYPDGASVRRRAELPPGVGALRVEGLPGSLDPASVRVSAEGGDVVAVELRERVRERAPDQRVQALRDEIAALSDALAAIADRREVQERLAQHLEALAQPKPSPDAPAPDVAAWDRDQAFLRRRMLDARAARRALDEEERGVRARLEALQQDLGRREAPAGVRVRDVLVDVHGEGAAGALWIDYVVPRAGWSPEYDLRAGEDLASLKVVHRARVWQGSGEDWRDVTLHLSTARPSRGAAGPEPAPSWVGLEEPIERAAAREQAEPEGRFGARTGGSKRFATPSDEGLSARFRLPAPQTILSQEKGSNVLIGRFEAPLAAERVCVPAVDPGVWVRGRSRNTSEAVLLAGRAAVYVGADYLGSGALSTTRPGEELVVPLGLDSGVTVERTQLLDRREREGVFRSRRVQREAWRVDLAAHASQALGRGPVEVIVHESLPRSTSDRIEVELDHAEPPLAKGSRWDELREEKGVLTWVVTVPRGGAVRIEHEVAVESPADVAVARRIER